MHNQPFRNIKVNRIAGSLGAEVSGPDPSEELDDEMLAEIRQALFDNLVIFFRGQELTQLSVTRAEPRAVRRWRAA